MFKLDSTLHSWAGASKADDDDRKRAIDFCVRWLNTNPGHRFAHEVIGDTMIAVERVGSCFKVWESKVEYLRYGRM